MTPVVEKACPHKPRCQRPHVDISVPHRHLPSPDGHGDLSASSSPSSGAKRGIPGDQRGCPRGSCCFPPLPVWWHTHSLLPEGDGQPCSWSHVSSPRHPFPCSVLQARRERHPPFLRGQPEAVAPQPHPNNPLADPAPLPAAEHGSPPAGEVRGSWGASHPPHCLCWGVTLRSCLNQNLLVSLKMER